MNTFLPYADFAKSAAVLDNKRLGKQRVECMQLLTGLLGIAPIVNEKKEHIIESGKWLYKLAEKPSRWLNHPASKMWKGYEGALYAYSVLICEEWVKRGFKDSCGGKIIDAMAIFEPNCFKINSTYPPWMGDVDFHLAQQSNLLRKDYNHYSQYFGTTLPDNMPYIWPVQ